MSYILDALKKSDTERKRGDVPNLQTVHIPVSTEHETPWLLYGFISVLLVVLAFVIGILVSGNDTVSDTAQIELTSKISTESGVDALEAQPKIDEQPELKPEPVVVGADHSKQAELKAAKPLPVTKPRSRPEPIKTEAALLQKTEPAYRVSADAKMIDPDLMDVRYLHELPEYQQQSIPEMSFAGHVYSTTASNRSVIINGFAMSEGDSIVQGLKIEQITASGVVFRFQDLLFKIDILQDWSFD